jgi:S1-C subfamily serine protease
MKTVKTILMFIIFFQFISPKIVYCQTYLEELKRLNKEAEKTRDRLEEQRRYDEYMYQLELEKKQKELLAIEEVKKEINELRETTISKILSYNSFDNVIIENKLKMIVKDYKNNTDNTLNRYGEKKYADIAVARDKIYSYSMETLRDKVFTFLSSMEYEKDKLKNFITTNVLTQKQIERIKKDYYEFLNDPFKVDEQGNYLGFSFDINKIVSILPSSATAFAITSDGYLVTNYHVVEDADSIIIKGINGDFGKEYFAEIVISDKSNDLALLRIKDNSFKQIEKIPFIISTSISAVGEDIFVLGYPLTNTMGKEVKLTNGIISSKTGFEGNITLYQISAPVQPGNSGGPLFDSKGNLIGIVNAKHSGAENVSYAIKSIYLINLIGSLEKSPSLSSKNTLKTKSLTELVKKLERFVYIVEVR